MKHVNNEYHHDVLFDWLKFLGQLIVERKVPVATQEPADNQCSVLLPRGEEKYLKKKETEQSFGKKLLKKWNMN